MKSKITFLLILFSSLVANAQIDFEDQPVIDNALYVQSPHSVVSADLDGDADQDVLTSSYFGNRLVWLENLDGAGTDFAPHTISTTIQAPWGVDAADLDGDGDLDAVAASLSGNNIIWYENTDGNGAFVQKQAMYAFKANFVKAVDMDNDNDLDLVWSSHTEGDMKWLRNSDGLGTFNFTQNIETNVSRIPGFLPADIDGDGDQDIVSSYSIDSSQHGVTWYKNTNGMGNFGSKIVISNAVNYVTSVYAGDIDGDGDIDVVSASATDNKIAWYENTDGLGTFGPQQVLSATVGGAMIVRLADADGDGDLDVFFGANDDKEIGWFENTDGEGAFGAENMIGLHGGDIRDIHFSDMDADSDVDFLTSSSVDNNVKLYRNTNGAGTFAPTIITKHIDGGRTVVAADMDGDGDKDIVAASYWDDKISWFENLDGQGNFYNTQRIISDTNNGSPSVAVGDIDGDGFNDVLATTYLEDQVVWFRNTDGAGNFGSAQVIDNDLYLASMGYLSDIDNDGDLDVFALGSGKITWYENLDGQGSFSARQTIDVINNHTIFDADFGDIDGDGDTDMVAASHFGLMYYKNLDGQGAFSPRQMIDALYDPYSVKLADVDNDGDNDIVHTGELDYEGLLGWSENLNGAGSFGSIQLISSLILTPKSVTVADFDNDGDIDVASADAGNGGIVAWYENTDGQGSYQNTQQIISQNLNSPNDLFAADIDGNNTIDIVTISDGDDKIVWHRNSGVPPTINSIGGTVRFDLLGDGCTETDGVLSGLLVVATDSAETNATFTQENGQFQLYTNETGSVTTQITSQLPNYYVANPASFESDFTGYGNADVANFCIEPVAVINDLSVAVYPFLNPPIPGFDVRYRIVYRNAGTTQLSGTVTYQYDNTKLNFLAASETIASQTGNTLTFDFTNLNPFETKTIYLQFNVFAPPVTNLGQIVTSTATITPLGGDHTENDNVFSMDQTVVGSYDPNDITCLEGDQVLIENADEYLHYLIRFQNTGTFNATNIRVDHMLDDKLEWNTMQLEALSHPGRVNIRNGSEVSFVFDNINLPDSTHNEPASHGYIAYKIKPKANVEIGDVISATADIYFDFNPAIVTNTATTEFVEFLSSNHFEPGKVSVYPNPTTGILNIASTVEISNIDIYNQLGQIVLSATNSAKVDISSLGKGIYIITLTDKTGASHSQKIIKE